MAKIHILRDITEKEMEIISTLRFTGANKTLKTRAMIIYAVKNSGLQNKQIASNLGIQEDTVTDTVKGFNKSGIDYLVVNKYLKSSNLDQYKDVIEKSFNEQPPKDMNEAVIRVKEVTGIVVSKNTLRKWLKKTNLNT